MKKKKRKFNARELKFAEYILQGVAQATAYKQAGYKAKNSNVAAVMANRLLKKAKVAEYIAARRKELTEKLQEETLVTKRDVILELKHLAFSRINRVLSFNADGVTLRDSEDIADEDLAAIESVKETKDGISLKMHDKVGPLTKIGEHLGVFEPEAIDPDRPRKVQLNVRVYGPKHDWNFNVDVG